MTGTALLLEDAVPLAYALVDAMARRSGIRVLAIKGPVPALQGIRAPHQSVDVDVLVDPTQFDDLENLLGSAGWLRDGFYDTPGIVPRHALTFRNPGWPNEIDVHYWFPGMLAEPRETFEALWARRTEIEIAHRPVVTGDDVVNATIVGLNQLRAAAGVDDLLTRLRDRPDTWLRDLADLAADIGAVETLKPLLVGLQAPTVAPRRPTVVPIDDWELLVNAESPEVLPWLVGLSREPWRRKPGFLWRALWLEDDRFRAWEGGDASMSARDVTRARMRRIRRGLRALPGAVRTYRRFHGGRGV